MQLTSEQLQIIQAPPYQDICVNACPGSGKTTTLIFKVWFMINQQSVHPSKIGLFTYNRFLAEDMKSKLKQYQINPESLGSVGTVHAFCHKETGNPYDLSPWLEQYREEEEVHPELEHILFDEYQDADEEIASFVKILSRGKSLLIVGDERQQIYTYKGADANRLLQLRDFTRFSLSLSFRCNKNICALLTKLYPDYPSIQSKSDGPKPMLYRSRGGNMHKIEIIEEIIRIVERHRSGSIAIISPTLRSDASTRFLNDIHANINRRCKVQFDCFAGEREERDRRASNVITSIHGVKGQEYDTVIFLNCVDSEFFIDSLQPEGLSKLFVGWSRARQNLYLFEHLFWSVGSLKWISENEDLLEKAWEAEPIFLKRVKAPLHPIKITEFIHSLSPSQKRSFLDNYTPPELVFTESGIGEHCGPPILSGCLIESLLASKFLGKEPSQPLTVYITHSEWNSIIKKRFPPSLIDKLKYIYPGVIRYEYFEKHGKILSLQIFDQKSGRMITEIKESNRVSTLMSEEYHQTLPGIIQKWKELTPEISEKNIKIIWDLLRFNQLAKLSLVSYDETPPVPENLESVLGYLQQTQALSRLKLNGYHIPTAGLVPHSGTEVLLEGEIDFESEDSLVEVKCHKDGLIRDEDWVQVILYNWTYMPKEVYAAIMAQKQVSFKEKREIYIYNPLNGQLWRRQRR